jgi:hypothetical protein
MSKIQLYKISESKFDELSLNITLNQYLSSDFSRFLSLNSGFLEQLPGSNPSIEIDINEYFEVAKKNMDLKEKNKKIAMYLHRDINRSGLNRSIFLDKELWAYINMAIFPKVINEMYQFHLVKDKEQLFDRLKRYILNDTSISQISRSGFRFLWQLADTLYYEEKYDLLNVAFDFIDPVQKLLERKMGNNPPIVRAFVQGIINNNYDRRFTNKDLRNKIPTHLSNFAQINIIDRLSYDDLVKLITKEQKLILGINL